MSRIIGPHNVSKYASMHQYERTIEVDPTIRLFYCSKKLYLRLNLSRDLKNPRMTIQTRILVSKKYKSIR